VSDGAGPYKIVGTDYRDIGDELNSLVSGAPFDYIEVHEWADDTHTSITHRIEVGFPRCGTRQFDMRFAESENIIDYSTVAADGDRFANDVYVLGPGEGLAMLKSRNAVRDGRLRRVAVVPVKDATQGALDKKSAAERRARSLLPDITDITVVDSPAAPLGAIGPGDDILITVEPQQMGRVTDWYRVLAINEAAEQPGAAVLKTQRSDSFEYAAATSADGQPQVITL
jgi:hypothetical protein